MVRDSKLVSADFHNKLLVYQLKHSQEWHMTWTTVSECYYPTNIYFFKVNNRNTRKRCEIYSKWTLKTPERRRSGFFYC